MVPAPANMQSQPVRPYRSKRSRPCDHCRSRKVCCRIDTDLPCTNCRQSNVSCTFLQPASKRPKPNPESLETSAAAVQHDIDFFSTLDGVFDNEFLLDPLPETQYLPVLQDSQAISTFDPCQQPSSPERTSEWESQFSELQPGEGIVVGEQQPAFGWTDELGNRNATGLRSIPVTVQEASGRHNAREQRDTQLRYFPDLSHVDEGSQSLDGIEGFSAQLFGLSGESDPYLLRHFHWDENNERPFIRVHFRLWSQRGMESQSISR